MKKFKIKLHNEMSNADFTIEIAATNQAEAEGNINRFYSLVNDNACGNTYITDIWEV